jgi:urease accessory protein
MGMVALWATVMTINPSLLSLTQWLSPSFPLGSFAYSSGLETAITDGTVTTASELQAWLGAVLCHGALRSDAIVLALSMKGEDISELAQAMAPSRERWEEQMDQGRAFAKTVSAITGTPITAGPLPVAVGQAARSLELPVSDVVGLYLHSSLSNLVSAAVRFMPLGQTAGQTVMASFHTDIVALSKTAAGAEVSDLGTGGFGADMAAYRHETQEVRLFKS